MRCQEGLPGRPRCGAAWTSSCRRVVAVKTESFTVGAPHTISMDFHMSFQVVLRIKLLPTFITIVHLQIGHFFSDGFPRWYMLGLRLSEVIHAWSLQCLIISIWGSSRLVWLFLLCILRPLSDLKAFPQMWHLKVSSPCCGSPSSGSTQLSGDTYRSRVFPSH